MLAKEECTCLSFLEVCGAALRACPMEAHGVLLHPLQVLMGNILPASQPTATLQLAPLVREPPLTAPSSASKPLSYWTSCSCQRTIHWRQKEGKPFMGLRENLCWDTNLVQATRWTYFEAHHPAFNPEESHNLSRLFWEMITSTNLLGSKVYEVQEVWAGQKDLRCTHHAMRGLPQGLQFFHLVPSSESPTVMRLKEIHHPNTLHCHAGLSYCPWCGKEGQNKGTVINHLQTMHYRLGLVCSGCLHYFTTTSEAMWHHGEVCRQPTESATKEEDEGPDDDDASTLDWFTPGHLLHIWWFLRVWPNTVHYG